MILLIDIMVAFANFESNVEDKNEEDDDDIMEICSQVSDISFISFIDESFIDDDLVQTSSYYNFKK